MIDLEILKPYLSYVPFSDRSNLPNCIAVYFVYNNKDSLIYIGKTKNLKVRWSNHHRDLLFTYFNASKIYWFSTNLSNYTLIEKQLIHQHRPVVNNMILTGEIKKLDKWI